MGCKLSGEYNIPDDVDELFENGEGHRYSIFDREKSIDNNESMQLFLECLDVPAEMVEADYGTQVIIRKGEERLQIDAGGLGDFCSHGFDVTKPNEEN